MENIFDIIDYKFFQVFAGDNRRINAEIIMVIADYFKQNHLSLADKEDLVNFITDYIDNRHFDNVTDDEGNDITQASSREKALNKINLFKRNGWLVEEDGNNYRTTIQFDENALIMIKAFSDIGNNSLPKEYTGYLNVVSRLLKYFDYEEGVSLLEQAYENMEVFVNRLMGLNTGIKKYLTKLLNDENLDAEKILGTLLREYQDNVINKAFSNLKLNDNPSKFKHDILNNLASLQSKEGLKKLIENYKKTKLTNDSDEVIEAYLMNQMNYIGENIENLQDIINLVDRRNAKYVRSSTAKLKFILNENFDVIGKIENILKLLGEKASREIYEEGFSLLRMEVIDAYSLYYSRTKRSFPLEIPLQNSGEIDIEYVEKVKMNLFKDDRYSKKTIDKNVGDLLKNRFRIKASDMEFNIPKDLIRIILIRLYAHHDNMCYRIEMSGNAIIKNNIEFNDYWIIKKEDNL